MKYKGGGENSFFPWKWASIAENFRNYGTYFIPNLKFLALPSVPQVPPGYPTSCYFTKMMIMGSTLTKWFRVMYTSFQQWGLGNKLNQVSDMYTHSFFIFLHVLFVFRAGWGGVNSSFHWHSHSSSDQVFNLYPVIIVKYSTNLLLASLC